MNQPAGTLGIIAGGGRLPAQLAETCRASGRDVFILGFENITDATTLEGGPHALVRLGAVGEGLDHLRKSGVKDVVIAGKVQRPSLSSLKPDAAGAKLLARMGTAIFGGDDKILKAVVGFFESEGFAVHGADQLLSSLVTGKGVLGKMQPDERAKADIAIGMHIVKTLGSLDIGQAVIVENGYVLGVEAAEGTDALITRCAALKRQPKGVGVLIKAKKPQQESRVDLPSIGTDTVEQIAAAGFAGIAVEAAATLILDQDKVIGRADALGVFLMGAAYE